MLLAAVDIVQQCNREVWAGCCTIRAVLILAGNVQPVAVGYREHGLVSIVQLLSRDALAVRAGCDADIDLHMWISLTSLSGRGRGEGDKLAQVWLKVLRLDVHDIRVFGCATGKVPLQVSILCVVMDDNSDRSNDVGRWGADEYHAVGMDEVRCHMLVHVWMLLLSKRRHRPVFVVVHDRLVLAGERVVRESCFDLLVAWENDERHADRAGRIAEYIRPVVVERCVDEIRVGAVSLELIKSVGSDDPALVLLSERLGTAAQGRDARGLRGQGNKGHQNGETDGKQRKQIKRYKYFFHNYTSIYFIKHKNIVSCYLNKF